MEDFVDFARLVEALRPWLGHLVVVGGWAHRLYRFHPLASALGYGPLRTRDANLALSLDAPLDGDIRAALSDAGFNEELSGEHKPPVTRYCLSDEDGGFYAEFLTPLRGDGFKRDGEPNVTMLRAGITAQKLHHLGLLLGAPWTISVAPDIGLPVTGSVDLLVPNPVAFVVQKLLIHKYRNTGKRAQDVLYIHDTLELFGTALDQLQTLWITQVRPMLPAKTAARAATTAKELFREGTDTIREAARIPKDRRLLPERIRATCEYGLEEVLGHVS